MLTNRAMKLRTALAVVACGLGFVGALWAFQRPFREFPGRENRGLALPPDWRDQAEWVFARLMYPPAYGGGRRFRFGGGGGGDWASGYSSWTTDYPTCERHFTQAMRRLTRVHTRSVEQPVNLDEGDQYDWPWLYAVEVGQWNLTDVQAKGLREYLLRGGFFFVDDFHGSFEWDVFMASMRRVFPDRQVVDIPQGDAIFHAVFDLDDKYQVPGAQFLGSGRTYERDGYRDRWAGIYDDKGRLMVAINHNMDLGDAWEHADNPYYPQPYSALAIRIGVNYVVYAMTH
jgi:hypothetical protein